MTTTMLAPAFAAVYAAARPSAASLAAFAVVALCVVLDDLADRRATR